MGDLEIAEGERQARLLFGDERYVRSRTHAAPGYRSDLLAFADEVVFGKVYPRPGLTLDQRALCTISALAVLGHANQLRVHVAAALRIGVDASTIAEVIRQMAMYVGFPPALNAMQILDETVAEREGAPS
jgi:4-carboxymuconolactone decarboxylase